MGRTQDNNIFNKAKHNMMAPETSDRSTAGPEYPNTAKAEENNHKNNFMKMIDSLKDKIKNSL